MKKIIFSIVVIIICFSTNTNAQTVKKQQTNKERLTKKTRTESNIKSVDFSKDEKKDITSPKKNSEKPKQLEVNRKYSKIKMISPTSVIINTSNTEDKQLNQENEYKAKKQSYRPKYHQKRKIIGNNKEETDD